MKLRKTGPREERRTTHIQHDLHTDGGDTKAAHGGAHSIPIMAVLATQAFAAVNCVGPTINGTVEDRGGTKGRGYQRHQEDYDVHPRERQGMPAKSRE